MEGAERSFSTTSRLEGPHSTIIDFGSLEFNWKSLDGTGASIDNGVKPSADFPQLLGLNLMEVAGWYWSQVQFFHNYLA